MSSPESCPPKGPRLAQNRGTDGQGHEGDRQSAGLYCDRHSITCSARRRLSARCFEHAFVHKYYLHIRNKESRRAGLCSETMQTAAAFANSYHNKKKKEPRSPLGSRRLESQEQSKG